MSRPRICESVAWLGVKQLEFIAIIIELSFPTPNLTRNWLDLKYVSGLPGLV